MLSKRTSSVFIAGSGRERTQPRRVRTLDLQPIETEGEEGAGYRAGSTHLVIDRPDRPDRPDTNAADAVVFDAAGEIETIEADPTAGAVTLDRYDTDGADCRRGTRHVRDFKPAWFENPDGTILHSNKMAEPGMAGAGR